MDKKLKLFIWADSPTASTGFGIVTENLCNYLKDYFDIAILGINYYGLSKYDTSKYFIYSVDKGDPLGVGKFPYAIEDFNPDLVLLFQDIWNIFNLKNKYEKIISKYPLTIYFPVDGRPFSKAWEKAILETDNSITYTEWARETIYNSCPDLRHKKKIHTLPHGIDTSTFMPYSVEDIVRLRKQIGWDGKFMITNVNRFQPRKHVNQTLRIASMAILGYKRCKCGNLYPVSFPTCDLNNCPSSDVVSITGPKTSIGLYLHMNVHEATMGSSAPDFLTSHALNYGFTKEHLNKNLFINDRQVYQKGEYTQKDLNNIYNASNVVISTSLGEGFGFSTAEALSSGTPVIVGKHSANFEVVGNTCTLVDNIALMNWGGDVGHTRPIMNPEKALNLIDYYYGEYVKAGYKKIPNLDYVNHIRNNFNWLPITEQFKNILMDSYHNHPKEKEPK